jgi:hypothetical protein
MIRDGDEDDLRSVLRQDLYSLFVENSRHVDPLLRGALYIFTP